MQVQALIGWATLALVLLSALPLGGNRPIVWILLAFCILALFVMHLALSVLRPQAEVLSRAAPIALLYVAVVAWGLAQVALPVPEALAHPVWAAAPDGSAGRIGADPGQGGHMTLRLATYGMIAWIMAASALDSERAWNYFKLIALFSTLLAVYGLWAKFAGQEGAFGYDRPVPSYVTATFVNRNSYAFYATMGFVVNLSVYLHLLGRRAAQEDGRAQLRDFLETFFSGAWLFAFGVLLCAAALALTQSRAGAGAGAAGLAVLLLAMASRSRTGLIALLSFPVLIAGFVAVVLGTGTFERFLDADIGGRLAVYGAIVEHIPDRPWLGQGIGAFHDTFRAYLPLEAAIGEWNRAHNTYLENVYELGIPAAAALYFVLAAIAVRLVIGVATRKSDIGLPAAALAAMTAGALHSAVEFPLQIPACAALFAAILGIGWVQSFPRQARASMTRREAENDI